MDAEEIWQVEVNGQIYETNVAEMAQWISEGSLIPQDKVRRGNLRWLEAGKVQLLHGFFKAKEHVLPTEEEIQTKAENFAMAQTVLQDLPVAKFTRLKTESAAETCKIETKTFVSRTPIIDDAPIFCAVHPDGEAKFVCETCEKAFCVQCPKSFGGNVKICPMCSAMCKPLTELKARQEKTVRHNFSIIKGFGIKDFGKALAFPFKYKTSLIFGAVLFMFFTLGQSVASLGGIYMLVAAISCAMMANALTFGVLANTVDNFSQGNLETNFMPDFDDFSLWDEVIHPFFLSLGVYLISFGALIVIGIGAVWYAWSSISSTNDSMQQKSVSTVMPDAQGDLSSAKQIPQIEQIQKQLNQDNQWKNGQMPDADKIAQAQNKPVSDKEADFQRLEQMINQSHKAQMESVVGKSPEEEKAAYGQMISGALQTGKIFIVPMFLALLWGLFYFPAACAVAGYTRSFAATLNPFVGLDTIKHLGFDYAKILAMTLILGVFSFVVGGVLSAVFSPLDLPKIGNLPAKAIGSFFTFYLSVVFSVILGYALYKNSERLNLYRG